MVLHVTCIRTGAIVYLPQYGEFITTDLKQHGDVFYCWIESAAHITREIPPVIHATFWNMAEPRRVGHYVIAEEHECEIYAYEGGTVKDAMRP